MTDADKILVAWIRYRCVWALRCLFRAQRHSAPYNHNTLKFVAIFSHTSVNAYYSFRVAHQKLIDTHNRLMIMFGEGWAKREHEDESPSLHPSPITGLARVTANHVTYSHEKFPDIHFWNVQDWKDHESSTKDTSELDSQAGSGQRGGGRAAKGKNVSMLFVEHADGRPISGTMAIDIRDYTQVLWKDFVKRDLAPEKWGDTSKAVWEEYVYEMENRWEVLRYCDNHWKANKIATKERERAKSSRNTQTRRQRFLSQIQRIRRAPSPKSTPMEERPSVTTNLPKLLLPG